MKKFTVDVIEPVIPPLSDWRKRAPASNSKITLKPKRKTKRKMVPTPHERKWTTAQFNVYLFGAGMR